MSTLRPVRTPCGAARNTTHAGVTQPHRPLCAASIDETIVCRYRWPARPGDRSSRTRASTAAAPTTCRYGLEVAPQQAQRRRIVARWRLRYARRSRCRARSTAGAWPSPFNREGGSGGLRVTHALRRNPPPVRGTSPHARGISWPWRLGLLRADAAGAPSCTGREDRRAAPVGETDAAQCAEGSRLPRVAVCQSRQPTS